MSDLLKKSISLGLGATIASKEKIQQMVEELVVRGELGKSESKDLVAGLVAKGEEQRDHIKRLVQEQVKKVLDELNVATKQDLRELEERFSRMYASAGTGGLTDPQASTAAPSHAASDPSVAGPTASAPSSPIDPTRYP